EGRAAPFDACSRDIPARGTRTSFVLREGCEPRTERRTLLTPTTQRASFGAAVPARDPKGGSRHTSDDALTGKHLHGSIDAHGEAPVLSTNFHPDRHGIAKTARARRP